MACLLSRRSFLTIPFAAAASRVLNLLTDGDMAFLKQMTLDVLAASRVSPGSHGPVGWPRANSCGFALVTPGKGGYPAYWVRDFSMATDSGLVPSDEIRNHLSLLARCQNGPTERKLQSGGVIPPYAIPDHINFDGSTVFFPGTYSPGEDQGGEPWGVLPPIDDNFEFIHIAYNYWKQSHDKSFLKEDVNGLSLVERLERAFDAPDFDEKTGLATTTEARRAVGFGFCDGIYFTGDLLMASLLRWRAAGELEAITGNAKYNPIQQLIAKNLVKTFSESKSGWLLAATGVGRQPDVWGTLFALHLGVLNGRDREKALTSVIDAAGRGTITFEGAVRHVPTDRDFSESSAWERTYETKNTYQNGAYWHTPTGWLLSALHNRDKSLFEKVREEFVAHLRTNDFRNVGGANGAPWECFGRSGEHRQNPAYLASVALPYSILSRIQK